MFVSPPGGNAVRAQCRGMYGSLLQLALSYINPFKNFFLNGEVKITLQIAVFSVSVNLSTVKTFQRLYEIIN
jgi:hypothetical protein